MHRQPRREGEPGRLGHLRQPVEVWPGALGVDVIGRHRRDATPVGHPGGQQMTELVGQVGWGLNRHVVGQDEARQRDRLGVGIVGARVRPPHGGAVLGQKILDDHLLHVPVTAMRLGDRHQRIHPVGAALADAHQNSGGKGNGQLTGPLQRRQAAGRHLVGRPPVRLQPAVETLDHHALRRGDPTECQEFLREERTGIGVG